FLKLASYSIYENRFNDYYRAPTVKSVSDVHKNLVLIYGESYERTYFNEAFFPGLIKELHQIEAKSLSFTNIHEAYGTGWTIAGMVGSQCGIPLVTSSHGNSMAGMDKFLASATCFGDVLHDNGYHLVYMGGADFEFAGKGKFYTTHKFD